MIESWAGVRPATADGAPVLGPDPNGTGELIFALGHFRNGVLFAPATAKIIARYVLYGETAPELTAFGFSRFAQ